LQEPSRSSKLRYSRGITLVYPPGEKSVEKALEILSNKENSPHSIFASGGDKCSWTICSAIFEITDGINLKIYPRERERGFMEFSLADLDF
jgi:hypothetical protein